MSDIIERTEAALKDAGTYWQPAAFGAGCLTLMPELIAELNYAIGDHCPRCDSPQPQLHPAVQAGGEVQPCPHEFHTPGWHPNH